jgi:nucleoside-diphosphate-sugar epimerase
LQGLVDHRDSISIAILGASGQIGRGLAIALAVGPWAVLRLYARQATAFERDARALGLLNPRVSVHSLESFERERHDVVINAAGAGSRTRQLALGAQQAHDTEALDQRVLSYLERFRDSTYVYLSTGAVYGFEREWPIPENASFRASPRDSDTLDMYPLAKLAAEARHRSMRSAHIYDIRIFGYFSRFITLDDGFFLSEVARSLVRGTPLRTSAQDMVRDYIDQTELAALIRRLLRSQPPNGTFDIHSAAPVGKHELLEALTTEFGLRVEYEGGRQPAPPLAKPAVPSACRRAAGVGHKPLRSSKEIVLSEMRALLLSQRGT